MRYEKEKVQSRDWVYLLLSYFGGLEEVVFELDGGSERMGCEGERWWRCVRDAMREGLSCSNSNSGIRVVGKGIGRRRDLVLRVRGGEWSACEVVKR